MAMEYQNAASPEWPVRRMNVGGASVIVQSVGDPGNMGLDYKSSFGTKHFYGIGNAFQKMLLKAESEMIAQPESIQKSRGFVNNSIELFVQLSYPALFDAVNGVRKDATAITTTTGFYNPVYGNIVWEQIIQEANAFG